MKEEINNNSTTFSIYGTQPFKDHLTSLYNNPTFSDVTLVGKKEDGGEYKFFAHRAILASWSEVFKQVCFKTIYIFIY